MPAPVDPFELWAKTNLAPLDEGPEHMRTTVGPKVQPQAKPPAPQLETSPPPIPPSPAPAVPTKVEEIAILIAKWHASSIFMYVDGDEYAKVHWREYETAAKAVVEHFTGRS